MYYFAKMFIDSVGCQFSYVNVDIKEVSSIVNVNARQWEGLGGKKEVNLGQRKLWTSPLVNFTTDLSDTLAEVKHLEHLGFTVPEVARNMSLQEGKLTGIAADLRKLVDKYHGAIDSINLAEEELMLPELKITQTSLNPGKKYL